MTHAPASANPRTAWWQEARFGLFIHYGLYALAEGRWNGQEVGTYAEWVMSQARVPVADWARLAEQFTAARFDAEAIARLAVQAGMGYVVLTAKHHDGFCLFRSAQTRFSSVDGSPCGRDLVREMADACQRHGLRFGVYYSHSQDWSHRGGNGNTWDPTQAGDYDDYLQRLAIPQVQELLDGYRPAVLWYDTPRFITPARAEPFRELHRRHPQLLVNDRLETRDFATDGGVGDLMTPEQFVPANGYPGRDWETCMTMNHSWGFKASDTQWKSPLTLLRHLSDIASKGGNFLLNIGPRGDGSVPAESIEALAFIGRWMERHAEAIRGTIGSPFPRRLPWGRVTRRPQGDRTRLYLHVWERPADGRLVLTGLRSPPVAATLLGRDLPVAVSTTADGVTITVPPLGDDPLPVVALTCAEPLVIDPPPPATDAHGRVILLPADAELAGPDDAKPVVVGFGADAVIHHLRDGGWRVRFHAEIPHDGVWSLSAEVGTAAFNRLSVTMGGDQGTTVIRSVWATETDGETRVEREIGLWRLKAGTVSIEIKAAMTDVRPLVLGRVVLTPVTRG